MHTLNSLFTKTSRSFLVALLCLVAAQAQTRAPRNARAITRVGILEQRTARYLESIRKSPPQQLAFFLQMPKGGDLHNHLSGSIYAESYVQWAAEKGLCVNNKTYVLPLLPCDTNAGQVPASTVRTNSLLY